MADDRLGSPPVFGVCGYSGSGKTTLIEGLIPRLIADGLAVAVVKHDAHGLTVDTAGKDTDRLFRAGATVFAHDPAQSFLRRAPRGGEELSTAVDLLLRDHDVVLVEGHKQTPLSAKLWLQRQAGDEAPPEARPVVASLGPDVDRLEIAYHLLASWLREQMRRAPLRAGVLIGGRSSRMGRPKQTLTLGGTTWAERVAAALQPRVSELCLLGDGEVPAPLAGLPRLADVPGRSGPLAGMLAAMRWDPAAAWIFAACDMPLLGAEAVAWLLDQRAPGTWAILPRRADTGQIEPLCAWYDPRAAAILETLDRPVALANHRKTHTPAVPPSLEAAWCNMNTPADCEGLA